MKKHQKHANLTRPAVGQFARAEWGILGMPCGDIRQLAHQLSEALSSDYRIAYVDADHPSADEEASQGRDASTLLAHGGSLEYTDKITFSRFDYDGTFNAYQLKAFFQSQDLVLVNSNHFKAKRQMVVIDPRKPLEKKQHKLTEVGLILLQEGVDEVPAYLKEYVGEEVNVPVLRLDQVDEIAQFLRGQLSAQLPPVHGLVLAGGKSTRMKQDKGLLDYHGKPQRAYAYELLQQVGVQDVFLSCREDQVEELSTEFSTIPDTFLGLGPFGGILSAFRTNPNAAWLVIACDLPFLTEQSLGTLLQQRNPQKIATAFQSPNNEFPEPLITLWEPKSYPVLLQFLSMGYSCPRKVLINSEIELLQAPDTIELTNVNEPHEYRAALDQLKASPH